MTLAHFSKPSNLTRATIVQLVDVGEGLDVSDKRGMEEQCHHKCNQSRSENHLATFRKGPLTGLVG